MCIPVAGFVNSAGYNFNATGSNLANTTKTNLCVYLRISFHSFKPLIKFIEAIAPYMGRTIQKFVEVVSWVE